jgi:hypothetical protein
MPLGSWIRQSWYRASFPIARYATNGIQQPIFKYLEVKILNFKDVSISSA